jgi:hypothetical protein
MTNKNTGNFTSSDDALILQQPFTGIGLKTLAKMIRTSQETLIRRADELGVSLSDDLARLSIRERSVAAQDSSTRYWNG